jgi:hypothetical protein
MRPSDWPQKMAVPETRQSGNSGTALLLAQGPVFVVDVTVVRASRARVRFIDVVKMRRRVPLLTTAEALPSRRVWVRVMQPLEMKSTASSPL